MNPNDLYRLCTFVFLIRLTEQSVNHHLREFNIRQKNTNELGPAWHIAGNYRIREQKKMAFSYSDPGSILENKLNDLKLLFSRKKSLTFQKRSKKMFLHWRANLANQNKQPLKINVRDTYHTVFSVWNNPLIDTCQHCSTSRANQALRSLANAGFQNRGDCLQAFPSFPSPSPHFHFLALVSFLARPKPRIPFLGLSPDLEPSTPTESSHTTCLLGGKSPSVKLMSRRENEKLAKHGQNLCLQSRSVFSSFGVVLTSCRVNFHVVLSALQYSACRI